MSKELPKIKTYRKSTAAPPSSDLRASASPADKGMEKLAKAQATLDLAKLEAQSTLAPILERMKQSRRVRSAEKVLRRMSAILEHPHKMRLALERGDLQEVVLIYQRVQAIPSTISLRILQRVKAAAEFLVGEMKRQLTAALLAPSTNHHVLLRYSKILLDLDGQQAYLDVLRQCIVRQLLHFVETARELRDRFVGDAADALQKASELSMMSRSAFYSAGDREVLAAALRKYTHQGSGRGKRGSSKKTGGNRPGGSLYLTAEDLDDSAGSSGKGRGSADEFEVGDEEAAEGEEEGGDWLDADDGSVFGDESPGGGGDAWERDSALGESGRARGEVDGGLLLSAHVRQHYLEQAVDAFAKWFPCLLRLASELLAAQAAQAKRSMVAGGTAVPFLGANTKSASVGSLQIQRATTGPAVASAGAAGNFLNSRAALRPPVSKLLGAAMRLYSDLVRHLVRGVSGPFQSFAVSPELLTAFGELPPEVPVSATLNAGVEQKLFETLAGSAFAAPLRDHFQRATLREVYELYDAVETTMNSAVAVAANAAGKAAQPAGTNPLRQHVPFSASPAAAPTSSHEVGRTSPPPLLARSDFARRTTSCCPRAPTSTP